jgi:hypothetical protein
VSERFLRLAGRIRGELADLDQLIERALEGWRRVQRSGDGLYLDSVVLNLHGFYAGLERLFELIARHVDGTLPTSETWHRDLLQQMARDLTDVRPAVIGQDSGLTLDEFRRFRHPVRNVYTMNLVPDRMAGLLSALPGLWSRLRAELLAFADFLEDLARVNHRLDERQT